MKKFLAVLFLTVLSLTVAAKGASGTYYIKGLAYGHEKNILKNITLTIKMGDETQTIQVNEKGEYEIAVRWTNTCPSKISKAEHEAANKRINPKYIEISLAGQTLRLKNDWEKYAELHYEKKEEVTWKKDLYFSRK